MHPQGCQILGLDPLLFGFNHMPVNWCIRQDSHLQTLRSKTEDDNNFTTDAEMEPMERLALSWGKCARQFTKLLLSLLSHIGEMGLPSRSSPPHSDESAYALCASARQPSLATT